MHPTKGCSTVGCSRPQTLSADLLLWGSRGAAQSITLCQLLSEQGWLLGPRLSDLGRGCPLCPRLWGCWAAGRTVTLFSPWQAAVAPCSRKQRAAGCAAGSPTWPSTCPKHGGRERHKRQATHGLGTAGSLRTTAGSLRTTACCRTRAGPVARGRGEAPVLEHRQAERQGGRARWMPAQRSCGQPLPGTAIGQEAAALLHWKAWRHHPACVSHAQIQLLLSPGTGRTKHLMKNLESSATATG